MKRILLLVVYILLMTYSLMAQMRVVDVVDKSPVSAASVFDAAGNMIGFSWSDGTLSDIPGSAYPITIRCMGYESITIKLPADKDWEMTPMAYELEEVVVVPVKRNILRQTFYAREYFSLNTKTDTITFFIEHMADRFVPTSKDAKFGGNTSLRLLSSRSYGRYKISQEDSLVYDGNLIFPSMLTIVDLNDEQVDVPDSFKESEGASRVYEKKGKSGATLIMKQNGQTFTSIEDALAYKKGHTWSPWPLKLLGYTLEVGQFYFTNTYRANDKAVYLPKDLLESGFVMEADGRGKHFRKMFNSETPIDIRSMVELYVVDCDYLSVKEAKEESRNKPADVRFVIPSSVPALNKATARLVERATSEANNDIKD